MPRTRGPMLALVAVAAASCARVPSRDPGEPPAHGRAPDPAARAARPDQEDAAAHEPLPDGSRAPIPSAPAPGPIAPPDRPSPTPAAVRDAVSGVVSARDLPAYGAPRALLAIAGMLERVTGGDPSHAPAIAELRRAVRALESLRGVSLDRSDHVRTALDRGVDAIRGHARSRAAEWLEPWVSAAATAAAAVHPGTPLALQRAAVQDALRSLADAVLVAEQFAPP